MENKHSRDSPNELRTGTIFAFFPRFGKPSGGREQPALILRTSFSLRWRPSELLPILFQPLSIRAGRLPLCVAATSARSLPKTALMPSLPTRLRCAIATVSRLMWCFNHTTLQRSLLRRMSPLWHTAIGVGWAKARARYSRMGKIARRLCPRGASAAGDFAHPTRWTCARE
jgi:hypothetical protein